MMRLSAALCAVVISGAIARDGFAQAEKEKPSPAYSPLPTANEDGGQTSQTPIQVAPIPDALRQEYRINPFYKKHLVIRGIPVIGAEEVTDYAFLECAWTLDHMLNERSMAL